MSEIKEETPQPNQKHERKRKPSYVIAGIALIIFGLIVSTSYPFLWGMFSFVGFFTGGVFLALRGLGKL